MSDASELALVEAALVQQRAARRIPIRQARTSKRIAPAIDTATAAERTQAGNANLLAELHPGNFRYVPEWDEFIVWSSERGRWERDRECVRLFEMAKDVGAEHLARAVDALSDKERDAALQWGRQSLSAAGIRDMVRLARGIQGVPVSHEALDADPWAFNVANGTIDLRTGTLRAASRADLQTKQSLIAYDPLADAPRFERALAQWFPDEDVRAFVNRLAGAALVGKQIEHVFVIHYGTGRNGKGTFMRALLVVFGPYAVTPHLSLLVQQKHTEHDTVKADLFRARLAIASETERRARLSEASVKNLTGGDPILARRMYQDPWSFAPSHSLWLQTNYLPQIAGRDRGIWSRMRVVPWLATFEGAPERDLDDTLAGESAGILAWCVRGCLAWQREGLAEPEAVKRATIAYRESSDVLARFARDTGLAFEPGRRIAATALRTLLDEWTATEGAASVKAGDFSDWLADNGATRQRPRDANGERYHAWQGIGLGDDTPGPAGPASSGESYRASSYRKDRTTLDRLDQNDNEELL